MRRRKLAALASGLIVASACFPASAQIYRCPDGAGYSLQQAPCAGLGQSGGRLLVLPNGSRLTPAPAPVATRVGASASASAGAGASAVAAPVRVLGRTPLPSATVARKPD